MAVGVALGVTSPAGAQPPAPAGVTAPPGAAQTQPVNGQQALDTAIKCYRRGEYELAAGWFQHAQRALDDLNEAQRTDLSIWIQLNSTDLKSRRDGGELLHRADQAARAGQTREAVNLLQGVASHQKALTLADKQLYTTLASRLLPAGTPEDGARGQRPAPAPVAPSGVVQASTNSPAPQTDNAGRPVLKGGDVAKQLMRQARSALKAGDLNTAMKLATEARAYKDDLSWWDESPDKLITEIQRAEAARKTDGQANSVLGDAGSNDPRALVKKARSLYNAGKLDEAEKVAQSASAAGRTVRWGLFEDSPDNLLKDIRKATQKRDQEQSARDLVEGRRLFERAKDDPQLLAQALDLAHRAERLNGGPYSRWSFGDRPDKLRADIEEAQARNRRRGIPEPSVVARQNPPAGGTPRPASPAVAQAQPMPPPMPPVLTPNRDSRVAQTSGTAPRVTPPAPLPLTPPPAPTPSAGAGDTRKPQALALLEQARRCQKEGRLVEARRCAVDAQNLKAPFRADEEGPDKVLLWLSAQANRQVETLVAQANDNLAAAGADPARLPKAETCLNQARELALAYGFDTHALDSRLAALRKPAPPVPAPAPAPAVAQGTQPQPLPAGPATQRGEELLRQARMELRRGETRAARERAVQAFSGNFGVREEAEKVIRSIDAEEFNQRLLAASRSYDAGVSALQRQDSAQALTIFRSIEPSLLPAEKQARLKEMMGGLDPQHATVAGTTPKATPDTGTGVTQASVPARDDNYAQQVKALQDVKYQQLREEGIRVQNDARDRFQKGDTDQALEILQDHLAALRAAQLEPQRVAMLRRPVEARLEQFKTLKAQRDFEKLQVNQRNQHGVIVQGRQAAEDHKHKQLAELMKQYHTLFKEGKYREAEMYAMRAQELDPDNAQTGAAVYTARTMKNQTGYSQVKQNKENFFVEGLNDAENPGPAVTSTTPIQFDPATTARSQGRKPVEMNIGPRKNEKEREIERKLHTPINLEFQNSPLEKALSDLQEMTGVNIHLDREGLKEAGIASSMPMSVRTANPISLKSALSILLKDAGLTYVIEDEVLKVTTKQNARGKLTTRTFPVADLVLPIENYSVPSREALLRISGPGDARTINGGGVQPHIPRTGMNGGEAVSPATLGSQASMTSTPGASGAWQKHIAKGTIEDLLIKLITNTIAPTTWSDMGGPATIDYYPLGMALIINQTPDIQEQIWELLQALRRLQDQEVAVEVRFVTIAESFFERIGLDFNVNFKTNTTRYEPQIVTQQFKPFGFINDFEPNSTVIGLTPAGSFTSDLDIPLKTSSFAMAVPPFGAFPNIPGGNGGIELGLAFLSDIQVFLFMEAAQGDQRTNVMQAPKLTLHNGQTATISIEDQQYFVTNATATQIGGQIVFTPTNQLVPIGGVSLTMQAVISADRRFVRMSLTPLLTNLASAVVQLFPITTFIVPVFEGGAQGQPVPFTQFLQQPVFNTISVQTTVAVPDGGTVLLGGLKRLSEGRNEFGPPILSKLPYINRLFKNVGYGREAESMMMMVTPRIIINEEEEERFLRQNPPAAGQPLP